jgi:hypothetical protein
MGGPDAPDDLALGSVTQAWLAVSEDAGAVVSGEFFFHQRPCATHPSVHDPRLQETLLARCAAISGVALFGSKGVG